MKDSSCIGLITGSDVINCMNTTRKMLRLVDLRVQRYLAGRVQIGSQLGREHSIQSLAEDSSDYKAFSLAKRAGEGSAL